MILFHSETNFQLNQKSAVKIWVKETIAKEGKISKDINFIFCDDYCLLLQDVYARIKIIM